MADDDTDSLQQALARLHSELARAQRLSDRSRQALRAALDDIEARLQQKDAATGEVTAPHGLDAIAVGFEAEHPSLAASLRQFIELLGQAGL